MLKRLNVLKFKNILMHIKLLLVFTFKPHNIHVRFCFLNHLQKVKTIFKCSCGFFAKTQRLKPFVIDKLVNAIVEKYVAFVSNKHLLKKTQLLLVYRGFNPVRFLVLKKVLQSSLPVSRLYFVQNRAFNGCRKKKQKRLLFIFGRVSEWLKVLVLKTSKK